MRTPVAIGVVGDPGSAAALLDALEHLPQADVRWVCSERRSGQTPAVRRGIRQTTRFAEVLDDERVDAVFVAAQAPMRAQLAASSLDADKHVYVAGVPAQSAGQAEQLVRSARRRGRCLLSGDPWRFDPVVARLVELVRAGELGDVLYVHGDHRAAGGDDPLLWSAAPEELAFLLRALGDEPIAVSAGGESYLDATDYDLVELRLAFATGIVARLTLSALDARPGSLHSVVGSLATAVVEQAPGCPPTLAVHARDGEAAVTYPRIPVADSLRRSCEAFLDAVRAPADAIQDLEAITIVDVLEQAQHALGRPTAVKLAPARATRELRVVARRAHG
jgi:predicted dehydrogenase